MKIADLYHKDFGVFRNGAVLRSEGQYYMIAQVGPGELAAINLDTANRQRNPIECPSFVSMFTKEQAEDLLGSRFDDAELVAPDFKSFLRHVAVRAISSP